MWTLPRPAAAPHTILMRGAARLPGALTRKPKTQNPKPPKTPQNPPKPPNPKPQTPNPKPQTPNPVRFPRAAPAKGHKVWDGLCEPRLAGKVIPRGDHSKKAGPSNDLTRICGHNATS